MTVASPTAPAKNRWGLIKRLELEDDYIDKNLETLRDSYKARTCNEMIEEFAGEIEIKYTDLYKTLNYQNIK